MNETVRSLEYPTLRQEALQSLQRIWQTRVAAISSSAVLLGLVGATADGFHGAISWFVPFLLFILCNTAAADISRSRILITRIGVYLELRYEHSLSERDPMGWEKTCSSLFSYMKDKSPLQVLGYLFLRDPLPWLSILQLALAVVVSFYIKQDFGAHWALPYAAIHLALFGFLLYQIYEMRWVDRDHVRGHFSKSV